MVAGSKSRTLLFGIGLALLAGLPGFARADQPDVGDKAPSWKLEDLSGNQVKFPDISKGRPVIVIFWATWCPYCKALMPRLAQIKQDFSAANLEVYAVDFSEQGNDPRPEIKQRGLPFVFLLNGDDAAARYDIWAVPALYIVKDGKVLYRLDYPPEDDPIEQIEDDQEKASLLAPWWDQRIRGVLTDALNKSG